MDHYYIKVVNTETANKIKLGFDRLGNAEKLSTTDFGTHFQSHSAVGFDFKPTSAAVDLGTSKVIGDISMLVVQ